MLPTDIIATVDVASILIPLVAAAIGATTVAVVSRHLRRQELYVEAAQKINDYIDEASDALNAIDHASEFDREQIGVAQRAVGLALFHSRRLESEDISGRLEVAGSILWDIQEEENYRGEVLGLSRYRRGDGWCCGVHDPVAPMAPKETPSAATAKSPAQHLEPLYRAYRTRPRDGQGQLVCPSYMGASERKGVESREKER